jgi:hypothetical protein
VYAAWNGRRGEGATAHAAVRDVLALGPAAAPAEMSPAARLAEARRLVARADSALRAGELERFARLYEELERLLGVRPAQLAPAQPRR